MRDIFRKLLATHVLSISNVQLTKRNTWLGAMVPKKRSTSSSPPWRSHPKGCWPAAPTTSSPSSLMTTNTTISPGNGASLSRKSGKTDSCSPSSRRLPVLGPSVFFSLSFCYFCLDYVLDLSFCSLRPFTPALSFLFLFFSFFNSNHSIIPPIAKKPHLFASAPSGKY